MTRSGNVSALFIRRPVATALLTAALGLAGVVAYRFLPAAPLPQVDYPTIQVGAQLPGASPETMASSVATPLERQFGRIAGITEMSSTSVLGSTALTLQFDLNRNIDAAARDVQAAINAARGQLPDQSSRHALLEKEQSGRAARDHSLARHQHCPGLAASTTSRRPSSCRSFRRSRAWDKWAWAAALCRACAWM